MIAEITIALIMATTPMMADDYTSDSQVGYMDGHTETVWVTEYCPACNSPAGHGSATGKYLTDGDCACGWLPMGSVVVIDGKEYTVVDVCGTDAIDIFVDDDSGVCVCDRSEYVEAVILPPED